MRRIGAFILAILMICALAGCAAITSEDLPLESNSPTPAPTVEPTPTPMSKIEYVRLPVFEKAVNSAKDVCSEAAIKDMIAVADTCEGDFKKLYDTILTAYELDTEDDWSKNELFLADIVHEYCEQAYLYSAFTSLSQNADKDNSLIQTFYKKQDEKTRTPLIRLKPPSSTWKMLRASRT